MYIKSKYAQVVLYDYAFCSSINCQHKNLWIERTNGEIKYIIGAIYRHPNGLISEFSNNFERTFHKISQRNIPCIISGDLNINLLKCNSDRHTDEHLKNLLIHVFLPVIAMPTRITSRSAMLSDHIYYFAGSNNVI